MLGLDNTDLSTSVNKLIFNVGLLLHCKGTVIKKILYKLKSNRMLILTTILMCPCHEKLPFPTWITYYAANFYFQKSITDRNLP